MKTAISFFSAFSICLAALLFAHCGPGPTGTKQAITVTSPATGAKLLAGDTIPVQWTQSVANPTLSYNYHLTSSVWQQFTTVIPVNSQEVKVVLPTTWYSDSFQIKVEDNSGVYDAGVSGYLRMKYIILTTDLVGQTIKVGDSVTLSWLISPEADISSVLMALSTDSGNSFNEISGSGSFPTTTHFFLWVVGAETGWRFTYPSSGCILRVCDYNHEFNDLSGIFTVTKP